MRRVLYKLDQSPSAVHHRRSPRTVLSIRPTSLQIFPNYPAGNFYFRNRTVNIFFTLIHSLFANYSTSQSSVFTFKIPKFISFFFNFFNMHATCARGQSGVPPSPGKTILGFRASFFLLVLLGFMFLEQTITSAKADFRNKGSIMNGEWIELDSGR